LRLFLVSSLVLILGCQFVSLPASESTLAAPSATSAASETPIPTSTAARTPPALPATYQSPLLNPFDIPHTYVKDTCQYLHDRWAPDKSTPGTIVLVVMLHSITQGKAESSDAMNEGFFARMMQELYDQKFQAITMGQFADFVESNARIPARSVLLMQDGRHLADNFDAHFRPYWAQWGWPVVNAWDNQGSTTEGLWAEQADMEAEGLVDHQVYGPTFGAGSKSLSDQYFTDQLQTPMDAFQERLHKAPIAVVWPNAFASRPAQIARKLGYRVGFTFNPRGPIMFNWVPQADEADRQRPSYVPEGPVGDPLMTLPRYWPYQVHAAIDSVRITGKDAASYAEQNKGIELDYYDIVCASAYGAIQN
jgi:hypothetical protein